MTSQEPAAPWHAAYPTPKATAVSALSKSSLLSLLQEQRSSSTRNFLVVDLRKADHEGGAIKGSLNLPAQSLHPSLPTLYSLVSRAGVEMVIFYCGSSQGRGTRAAGWFRDYLEERGDTKIKSVILADGIKGWAKAGEEYTALMAEYEEMKW